MGRIPDVNPRDAHNLALLANVHPPDWQNPEPADRYNLVVVGAGTAGLISAALAAGLGARVALVERHLLGGDCLNVGCVPSKTLIRAARSAAEARRAADLGLGPAPGAAADFGAAMERVRRVRARISRADAAARYRDELGVQVFLGDARFVGRDEVAVDGRTLRFRRAVIAAGARALVPPIEGLAEAGYLTNESLFDLTERPRRLGVLGGGPIGAEMAQAFQRLGSEVCLFEQAEHILCREDADAAAVVQDRLRRDGVQLYLRSRVEKVDLRGAERIVRLAEEGGGPREVPLDALLVAAGRAPNVEGLGLEAAGVDHDTRRGVRVNDYLQTSNRAIYAAGDVCMDWKFTHAADAAAKIVVENALFLRRKRLSSLVMPWCTYTDPELAHVGLHPREAAARNLAIDTFEVPLADVDRAVADGEEEGFVKVHVRKGGDEIVGATIVAAHAGEMISEITLAMVGGIGLSKLLGVIHPYPTQAEGIVRAAGRQARARLTPRIKRLLRLWMAFRR